MTAIPPTLLFAPGAGAASTSPWMTAWARHLGAFGKIVRFDYPYTLAGRRRPDAHPVLVAAHRAAWADAGEPTILVGKSMGSRIGCHLSLEVPVRALVCFGYPLCGSGARDPRREALLRAVRTPVLFVQGTRDRLCPLDLLAEVRAGMTAPSMLHIVPTGDHGLAVTKTSGIPQASADADILHAMRGFLDAHLA